MELLLTGNLISADEALQLGFMNHVVEGLIAKAMEIGGKIAANGPSAVKAIRKSVKECLGKPEGEASASVQRWVAPLRPDREGT